MKRGILFLLCVCLVLIIATGAFLIHDGGANDPNTEDASSDSYAVTDLNIDSESEPDMSYSPERMKKLVTKLTSAIVDLFENKDEKRGDTIDIKDRIEVSQGAYTIGYNNTYVFSKDGRIVIDEGGSLILGDSFTIKGEDTVIELKKGSTVHIFGVDVRLTIDLNIAVKGSLKQYFEVTGNLEDTSLSMNIKGDLDLDGILSVGVLMVKGGSGSELEADVDLGIDVDASSSIKDIKTIADHLFDLDVGAEITVGINSLRSSINSSLLTYMVDVDSFKFKVSSPLNSRSLALNSLDIHSIVATMTSYLTKVHNAQIDVHNVQSTKSDETLMVDIPRAIIKIESLAKTLYDIEVSTAKFDVALDDRISLTMHTGQMTTNYGKFEADLDIREGCQVSFLNTDVNGELKANDLSTISGLAHMPFRTSNHAVIGDLFDASFAEDEEATLYLNFDTQKLTIYPNNGYRILEFQSDRYVEYVVDESGLSAEPKALKGTFYAELGTREYYLWIEDKTLLVRATEIVQLPTPEPQPGKVFFGWSDSISYYKDEYEMPAHDVSMTALWTDKTYNTEVVSGTYIIRTESPAVLVSESLMKDIKSKIDSGEVRSLRMSLVSYELTYEITLQKEDITAIDGSLEAVVFSIDSEQMPEREKVIGKGKLFAIVLNDSKGPIEKISKIVDLKVTLTRLDTVNTVESYYMDDLGRLTKLDCDYGFYTVQHESEEGEIEVEQRADVTIHTNGLPYCIAYTSFVPVTGISLETLLISLIPVIVVGIILAFISRRT